MGTPSGKESKVNAVAGKTLQLIERHGLDAITFSRVARAARVSRAWLYKYVGTRRDELIEFAVDHFGRQFADLDHEANPSTPDEWISETLLGTEKLLADAAAQPWIVHLYFRYRGTRNVFGLRIRKIEEAYTAHAVHEIQGAFGIDRDPAEFFAQALTASRMGIAHQWITSEKEPQQKNSLLLLIAAALKGLARNSAKPTPLGAKQHLFRARPHPDAPSEK